MHHRASAPGSVVAAGVLLAIYGSLQLLCGFCGVFEMTIVNQNGRAIDEKLPGFIIMKSAQTVSFLGFGLASVIAGVGLFHVMRAARYAAYFVCVTLLVLIVARSIYVAVVIVPALNRLVGPAVDPAETVFTWIQLFILLTMHLGFGIPILACLSAPSARDAFAGVWHPPGDIDVRERLRRFDVYDDDDYGSDPPRRARGPYDDTDFQR